MYVWPTKPEKITLILFSEANFSNFCLSIPLPTKITVMSLLSIFIKDFSKSSGRFLCVNLAEIIDKWTFERGAFWIKEAVDFVHKSKSS